MAAVRALHYFVSNLRRERGCAVTQTAVVQAQITLAEATYAAVRIRELTAARERFGAADVKP